MDTLSRHLTVDLWLDEPLTDDLVEGLLARAREHLTVMREAVHRFEPQGTTAVLILAESHFSLHTWPEADYVSLDLYLCNPDADAEGLVDAIVGPLAVRRRVQRHHWRGAAGDG
ncbi:MAG: S-adenosylmethionine decarboxylase family protein [Myxococcota bacterium]